MPRAHRPSSGKGKWALGKLRAAHKVLLLLVLLLLVVCRSVFKTWRSSPTVAVIAGVMGAAAEVVARQAATAGRPSMAAWRATATAACESISASKQVRCVCVCQVGKVLTLVLCCVVLCCNEILCQTHN